MHRLCERRSGEPSRGRAQQSSKRRDKCGVCGPTAVHEPAAEAGGGESESVQECTACSWQRKLEWKLHGRHELKADRSGPTFKASLTAAISTADSTVHVTECCNAMAAKIHLYNRMVQLGSQQYGLCTTPCH